MSWVVHTSDLAARIVRLDFRILNQFAPMNSTAGIWDHAEEMTWRAPPGQTFRLPQPFHFRLMMVHPWHHTALESWQSLFHLETDRGHMGRRWDCIGQYLTVPGPQVDLFSWSGSKEN